MPAGRPEPSAKATDGLSEKRMKGSIPAASHCSTHLIPGNQQVKALSVLGQEALVRETLNQSQLASFREYHLAVEV